MSRTFALRHPLRQPLEMAEGVEFREKNACFCQSLTPFGKEGVPGATLPWRRACWFNWRGNDAENYGQVRFTSWLRFPPTIGRRSPTVGGLSLADQVSRRPS